MRKQTPYGNTVRVRIDDGKVSVPTDGTEVRWHRSSRHDEGWSAEGWTLWFDASRGMLVQEWWTDGTDCDGRLSSSGVSECPHHRRAAWWTRRCGSCGNTSTYARGDGSPARACYACHAPFEGGFGGWIKRPDWTRVDASQRDYSAEAMGY